jgi:hypothetical protein
MQAKEQKVEIRADPEDPSRSLVVLGEERSGGASNRKIEGKEWEV